MHPSNSVWHHKKAYTADFIGRPGNLGLGWSDWPDLSVLAPDPSGPGNMMGLGLGCKVVGRIPDSSRFVKGCE